MFELHLLAALEMIGIFHRLGHSGVINIIMIAATEFTDLRANLIGTATMERGKSKRKCGHKS
jgi:hypothetical protein